jgi:phosphoglycerol transferase MdoB-like AlkP superfamily enzyme
LAKIEENSTRHELGRRRVYIFFAAFFALALVGLIPEEIDIFTHAIDEMGIVTISIIVLILIAIWRKKTTLAELKRQHNIITILFVVALLFKLYAFTVEINDPQDFGDEIPVLIGIILTLLNRFV